VSVQGDITELLVEAGATQGALSYWWGSPRAELNYFSPRHALELFPPTEDTTSGVGGLVLTLAQRDARDLKTAAAGPVGAPAAVPQPHATGGRSRCREG
jgi:hypothetical protein